MTSHCKGIIHRQWWNVCILIIIREYEINAFHGTRNKFLSVFTSANNGMDLSVASKSWWHCSHKTDVLWHWQRDVCNAVFPTFEAGGSGCILKPVLWQWWLSSGKCQDFFNADMTSPSAHSLWMLSIQRVNLCKFWALKSDFLNLVSSAHFHPTLLLHFKLLCKI